MFECEAQLMLERTIKERKQLPEDHDWRLHFNAGSGVCYIMRAKGQVAVTLNKSIDHVAGDPIQELKRMRGQQWVNSQRRRS